MPEQHALLGDVEAILAAADFRRCYISLTLQQAAAAADHGDLDTAHQLAAHIARITHDDTTEATHGA